MKDQLLRYWLVSLGILVLVPLILTVPALFVALYVREIDPGRLSTVVSAYNAGAAIMVAAYLMGALYVLVSEKYSWEWKKKFFHRLFLGPKLLVKLLLSGGDRNAVDELK